MFKFLEVIDTVDRWISNAIDQYIVDQYQSAQTCISIVDSAIKNAQKERAFWDQLPVCEIEKSVQEANESIICLMRIFKDLGYTDNQIHVLLKRILSNGQLAETDHLANIVIFWSKIKDFSSFYKDTPNNVDMESIENLKFLSDANIKAASQINTGVPIQELYSKSTNSLCHTNNQVVANKYMQQYHHVMNDMQESTNSVQATMPTTRSVANNPRPQATPSKPQKHTQKNSVAMAI